MKREELEQKHEQLAQLLDVRANEQSEARSELARVIAQLASTADAKERKALIAKHTSAKANADALADEVHELERQTEVAYFAIYENEVTQARAELIRLAQENRELVNKQTTIEQAHRVFTYNNGRAIDEEYEKSYPLVKAQVHESSRAIHRAKARLERAENEMREVQEDFKPSGLATWR